MGFFIKKRKENSNNEDRIYFSLFGKDFIYYNSYTGNLRLLCFHFITKKHQRKSFDFFLDKHKTYQRQYSESLRQAVSTINVMPDYKPEISVVMPVYNSSRYLEEALQSLVEQTFPFCEFICVDDGSIDSSGEILDRYAESDVRFRVFHQKNAGAGRARNFGMSQARGKYTVFLDSDDIFYPNMLYELRKRAEETDADIVVCRYNQFQNEDPKKVFFIERSIQKIYMPDKEIFNINDFKNYAFQLFSGMPWNKLFRTEFIRNTKYKFLNLKNSNDTFFVFMNIFKAKKIACVENALLKYRVLNDSISHSKDNNPLCFLAVLERTYNEIRKRQDFAELRPSFINRVAHNTRWNFSLMSNSTISDIKKNVTRFYRKIGIFDDGIDKFYDEKLFYFVKKFEN